MIKRKIGTIRSRQPRFALKKSEDGAMFSYYNYVVEACKKEPPYLADSRTRDKWLREFVRLEPNLSGVISTVCAIDKNRGWQMVGGRNQVSMYSRMLHDMQVAPGVHGWRAGISHISESFWSTDIGAVLELGRDGESGPLRALYAMDPARCRLSRNVQYPLSYFPTGKGEIKLREEDFLRISSMPSTDESMSGLGYCAVSRCLELAKLMLAVYDHDKEQLGAQAPRGLLLINGITQKQWNDAMEERDADMEQKEIDYFSSVAVLASTTQNMEAKLVALSSLPTSFNLREWMDMVMYGYALCFGYDPSEFWPVQFGALGRGTETEIQHEKATGKGRLDCVLNLQEQLQGELPDSLEFLFDQRDEKGELLHAEVAKAWGDAVSSMNNYISIAEGRVLLAEQKVIPTSWAPTADSLASDETDVEDDPVVNEDEQIDATKQQDNMRDALMTMPRVLRAIEKFPAEPLVQYSYPDNRVSVLAYRADDLLRRRIYRSAKPVSQKKHNILTRILSNILGDFA